VGVFLLNTVYSAIVSEENQGALVGLIEGRKDWLKAMHLKVTSESRVCFALNMKR